MSAQVPTLIIVCYPCREDFSLTLQWFLFPFDDAKIRQYFKVAILFRQLCAQTVTFVDQNQRYCTFICFFTRLFMPLRYSRKYYHSEKCKIICYFTRLFVPLQR